MTTTATNLAIVSATVHPGTEHGTEQITIVLNGPLGATVTPAGIGSSTARPSADRTSQYTMASMVGTVTMVLTTTDHATADTYLTLANA